ncbi:hypothetical protein ACQPZP_21755 [Spirillospora sp. CA-142024]|uniref:hypothetical protein n=1 Tax=Spirillospora sp. CA-142024 TaxID=3240036 RepID=UPI003D8DC975
MIARRDTLGGREPDERRDGGARPSGWLRADASMSLLADLIAGKRLDPGYAEAAARRAAAGETGPRRGRLRGAGVLLVVALAGTLVAVAGVEARRSEPVAAERRSRLIGEIHARTAETDGLQRRLDRLRADTERRRAAALARSDSRPPRPARADPGGRRRGRDARHGGGAGRHPGRRPARDSARALRAGPRRRPRPGL